MSQRVLSAKLPQELVDDLGRVAAKEGVSRNRLVREALEAIVEGRVVRLSEDEGVRRALRAAFARDRMRLRSVRRLGLLRQ